MWSSTSPPSGLLCSAAWWRHPGGKEVDHMGFFRFYQSHKQPCFRGQKADAPGSHQELYTWTRKDVKSVAVRSHSEAWQLVEANAGGCERHAPPGTLREFAPCSAYRAQLGQPAGDLRSSDTQHALLALSRTKCTPQPDAADRSITLLVRCV